MPASSSPSTEPDGSQEPELRIANEFADIRLRRVRVGNSYRIELHSRRRDRKVLLDPMALDAISRLRPDQLSRILTLVIKEDDTTSTADTGKEYR
ncbi:hypothetical protein P6B95_01825 [Streptomyces atratus]|uniref:hypothetical protein n=1 Tax=Streptomyces atratus TaxID=1893 RepID=UPI0016701202|nr:hypothetical protein [Streptomyces atratus]WPW26315.1 hypothetical protein P6B95_01825 [Streptomyces atratus]GGT65899.1 hypothetical protein GCM10010207_76240 [Streptomyces atratus]